MIPSTQDIHAHIESSSLAVRPPVLPEVQAVVESVPLDLTTTAKYETKIVEWFKPICDLSGFHVYPTNGITEGLNYWMMDETRSIKTLEGDYQWVEPVNRSVFSITYCSNPDAATGNWRGELPLGPVALDLAYVGSTAPYQFDVPNDVDFVFYSLSKSFGLRNIRTGWMFSRPRIERLDKLIGSGKYYNHYAHAVAEAVIDKFSPFYTYTKYLEQQIDITMMMGFEPSDSVWLATTDDDKYSRFKRNSEEARINLSGLYR